MLRILHCISKICTKYDEISPLRDHPRESWATDFQENIGISPPAEYRSSERSSASGCRERRRSPCCRCSTTVVISSAVDLHRCCSAAPKSCAAAEQEPSADSSVAVRVAVFVEDSEFRPLLNTRRKILFLQLFLRLIPSTVSGKFSFYF